jgi:hypothetical protein
LHKLDSRFKLYRVPRHSEAANARLDKQKEKKKKEREKERTEHKEIIKYRVN